MSYVTRYDELKQDLNQKIRESYEIAKEMMSHADGEVQEDTTLRLIQAIRKVREIY